MNLTIPLRLHGLGSAGIADSSCVALTSADLDQSLALLLLRELQPIHIFAAASIRRILFEDNTMFSMLNRRADQAHWHDIVPGTAFKLFAKQSQIECLPLLTGPEYSQVRETGWEIAEDGWRLELGQIGSDDRRACRELYPEPAMRLLDRQLRLHDTHLQGER